MPYFCDFQGLLYAYFCDFQRLLYAYFFLFSEVTLCQTLLLPDFIETSP